MDTPKLVQTFDFTVKCRSLETTGAVFGANLMVATDITWFAKVADAPAESREALGKNRELDPWLFQENGPAVIISRAVFDVKHLENDFPTQLIDVFQLDKFIRTI